MRQSLTFYLVACSWNVIHGFTCGLRIVTCALVSHLNHVITHTLHTASRHSVGTSPWSGELNLASPFLVRNTVLFFFPQYLNFVLTVNISPIFFLCTNQSVFRNYFDTRLPFSPGVFRSRDITVQSSHGAQFVIAVTK